MYIALFWLWIHNVQLSEQRGRLFQNVPQVGTGDFGNVIGVTKSCLKKVFGLSFVTYEESTICCTKQNAKC